MIKRITLALGLGLCFALAMGGPAQSATGAAQSATDSVQTKEATAKAPPIVGTIASIKGLRVEITVVGEKPAWVKKGGGVKLPDLKGALGKVVDVSATGIAINTKKASDLKVGDKITVEKGNVVPSGC